MNGNGLPGEGGVTELVLLMPSWEAAALEQEAGRRGLTVGQMLRLLVRDAVRQDGPGVVGMSYDALGRRWGLRSAKGGSDARE